MLPSPEETTIENCESDSQVEGEADNRELWELKQRIEQTVEKVSCLLSFMRGSPNITLKITLKPATSI